MYTIDLKHIVILLCTYRMSADYCFATVSCVSNATAMNIRMCTAIEATGAAGLTSCMFLWPGGLLFDRAVSDDSCPRHCCKSYQCCTNLNITLLNSWQNWSRLLASQRSVLGISICTASTLSLRSLSGMPKFVDDDMKWCRGANIILLHVA